MLFMGCKDSLIPVSKKVSYLYYHFSEFQPSKDAFCCSLIEYFNIPLKFLYESFSITCNNLHYDKVLKSHITCIYLHRQRYIAVSNSLSIHIFLIHSSP